MPKRVIVWGTGNVGRPALRTVVANPDLELAGVVVSSPDKIGRDAGELCGLGHLGVAATDDLEQAARGGADAVAYCASGDFRPDDALVDLERSLRAGLDVVSTSVYPLYDPSSAPVELRERMERACAEGDASCFVSGIDPGFINDVVPLLLTGLCERATEIRMYEVFNYALYDAEDAVRDLVGMGRPMEYVPPMVAPGVPAMIWGGVLRLLARGLGAEIEDLREHVERRELPHRVENQLGVFEAGTQGAFRFELRGYVGGEPRLVVEHVTRITDDIAPEWQQASGGSAHGVKITGAPNIHVSIEADGETGDRASGGNATAAARVVNAIPRVCDAPAGLLDALSVPLAPARGLFA